ncbi:hypothetical protein MPH_11989 [Macrophomina phaseolina MS6]|uniref:Uncharacterized protein n=1 Tax=Macrophomina phaseolina (strain MS6) TaxID=1126212 RepID=K2QM83_MACPH|nr:hypothetical protein MPH_11989 [Macrophomina phaseolina MS6]
MNSIFPTEYHPEAYRYKTFKPPVGPGLFISEYCAPGKLGLAPCHLLSIGGPVTGRDTPARCLLNLTLLDFHFAADGTKPTCPPIRQLPQSWPSRRCNRRRACRGWPAASLRSYVYLWSVRTSDFFSPNDLRRYR